MAILLASVILLLALVILLYAFISNQFQLQYVAMHSSRNLPLHLKLAALWAGQEGSLLLWAFLQVLFTAIISHQSLIKETAISKWAGMILGIISVFFIAMVLFFSNPFTQLAVTPADGLGMNPLLRHPAMVSHPPILYLGYVGLSVPFAYAIAAVILNQIDKWPKLIRKWLLISWLALGTGIFLGARWAYGVLGWGGYWGWDPVENAGLMPWLTATALLHGLSFQGKQKGFKVWNVSLAVLSFGLVLLGTFITRSGLIESVHAFTRSELGPYFLSMILIVLMGSLILLLIYRKSFGELIYPEKVISREGSVFFTLIILVLITLSILSGTLLPTLTNGRFSAPTQWFNQVIGPQLGALVFLMGVCPLLGRYGRQIKGSIWKGLPPFLGFLFTPVIAYLLGFEKSIALIGFALAGIAGGTAIGEVIFNLLTRIKNKGGISGIKTLPLTRNHGHGGQLVHLGVVLMAIGVIGTQLFSSGTNITLSPGEMVEVQDYTLVYEDLSQDYQEDVYSTSALISVYRKAQFLDFLEPQLLYYVDYEQTIAKPAIRAGIVEDLYIVLFQWFQSGVVNLNVTINPLSSFLWFGGFLLMVGGFLAWWPSALGQGGDHPKKIDRNSNVLGLLFVILIFFVLIFSFWGDRPNLINQSGRLLPGQPVPKISAVDINGTVFSLEKHTGKTILVHFWATWCAECEEELRMIEKTWRELDHQKFEFVGIAMNDTHSDAAAMATQLDLSFTLIADPDGMICDAYRVSAVPETIVIGPTGEVVKFFIGAMNEESLKQALFPTQ